MSGKLLSDNLTRYIKRSRKATTILFTDIEASTQYWDRHGDVKGRLLVDRHNRLVFPAIRHFRGRIIKTIGDAVMARFRRPEQAVFAAIAIQQALAKERGKDKKFKLRVRIGIHTGKAIVEHGDVYGDVVNVASRVESRGKGDEILVSASTASKLKNSDFGLIKKGSFIPKGKKKSIMLYRCQWQGHPTLIENITFNVFLPLVKRQKTELLVFLATGLGMFYFVYLNYFRYLLSDSETRALLTLNPQDLLAIHPLVPSALIFFVLAIVYFIVSMQSVPHTILRILKGGFGLTIGFFILYFPQKYFPLPIDLELRKPVYESSHLFVEVTGENAKLYTRPSIGSYVVREVKTGQLLLLTDVSRAGGMVWNKVLVAKKQYAWMPRVIPPRIGVPSQRMSVAYKFYFRRADLIAWLFGLVGFAWGYLNFRLRPT